MATYRANAWPTFCLIGPESNVLGFHSGEGICKPVQPVITGMVAEFAARDFAGPHAAGAQAGAENLANTPLYFPAGAGPTPPTTASSSPIPTTTASSLPIWTGWCSR
ncbi:MAG: hypothetical protein R3D55_23325 [Chloroflexota bacterium]